MTDLAYAFTLYFITLGPLKTVPAFFLITQSADRQTAAALAWRSTVVATAIVLFVAIAASGSMVTWRVSPDAIAIAGGIVLLLSATRMLTTFHLSEPPAGAAAPPAASLDWMGGPVLSPLAIPSIVTPIGVVVVLYFSGLALGDSVLQARLVGLLLMIMGLNLVAMLYARPIMRAVGLPVLQVIGWVFSALQAGLAVEVLISALRRLTVATILALAVVASASAQELEPRAYSASPIGTTFVLAGFGKSEGGILFDPALDIDNVQADLWIATTGVGRTFGFAGRQARVLAVFPIAWGAIAGSVHDQAQRQDLVGLADPRLKLTVGLIGTPALTLAEFRRAPRQTAVGASVTIVPPLGQYSETQLVNLGYNRWAVKPEIGASHPLGRWTLEGSAGVWLFTTNDSYYPGHVLKRQDPVLALQGHVSYSFPRGSWLAVNGTWFAGGETRVDDALNPDLQRNTRLGVTYSLPVVGQHSLKFVYNTGTTTRRGTDFNTFNVTWQLVLF